MPTRRRSSNTRRRSRSLSPKRLSAGRHDDPLAYENLTGHVRSIQALPHGSADDYVHHMTVRGQKIYRGGLVRIGDAGYTVGMIVRDRTTVPGSYAFSVNKVDSTEYSPRYFRYTPAHGGARRRHTRRSRK